MARALILGGGFGGISAALTLRRLLDPADEVVLVERRSTFAMGLRKNWALAGVEPHEAGERPLARLRDRGIDVWHASITAIDPAALAAEVEILEPSGAPSGRLEWVGGDALVVALGAERDVGRIPGLREHAVDAYDASRIGESARRVAEFDGGRVVVGIFGAPYPCPPGPYELAILLAERFESRGLSFGMLVFTPLPKSLPILGEAGCAAFDGYLAGAGISLRTNTQAVEVRPGEVVTADAVIPFDLLLAVPPHRAPAVVAASGLTGPSGWVVVDPRTLETRFKDVYAVGDVTAIPLASGGALPKAGVFAAAEGEVVAERIAARFAGRTPEATFDGEGVCFMETGRGTAAMVRGRFLDDPPQVELTPAAPEHLAAKRAFEAERLAAWFGE
jgi:sulfide:quinone oxidoreductase